MATTKNEVVETTAEQDIAAMKMAAQKEIDAAKRKAEKIMQEANAIMENAKLTAASIPHVDKKTLNAELDEADKMSMEERMKAQFGDEERVSVAIPFEDGNKDTILNVTINGWEYPFRRGNVYSVPKALMDVIMGSVYSPSEAEKKLMQF